jgi:hypothetical protein
VSFTGGSRGIGSRLGDLGIGAGPPSAAPASRRPNAETRSAGRGLADASACDSKVIRFRNGSESAANHSEEGQSLLPASRGAFKRPPG